MSDETERGKLKTITRGGACGITNTSCGICFEDYANSGNGTTVFPNSRCQSTQCPHSMCVQCAMDHTYRYQKTFCPFCRHEDAFADFCRVNLPLSSLSDSVQESIKSFITPQLRDHILASTIQRYVLSCSPQHDKDHDKVFGMRHKNVVIRVEVKNSSCDRHEGTLSMRVFIHYRLPLSSVQESFRLQVPHTSLDEVTV